MGKTLTYKILEAHLVEGELKQGQEIGIRIDQTLTQDATGTTAMLLFESMGIDKVKTELSVSYVDHNTAQFGPENHTDHLYLQSAAHKYGIFHSRPGNGICHQVHLERFAKPGATQLGSDSHTPTAGGAGAIAIGAGGLDVAVAMGGGAFYMTTPKVIGIKLTGELSTWVAAKDVILKVLSILTTQGNVGCIAEYFGPGVATLSVPQRATITNMGAELGVTTSVFPSDARTADFLAAQNRPADFVAMEADLDAEYDRLIEIDLSELVPLCAAPSSPDNIKTVAECKQPIGQVVIGSCTNSSYRDLMIVAEALKGQTVHSGVELGIAPGSKQVMSVLAGNGALQEMILAGVRILESACGPCIGQGQSPADGVVSVRTFNRNFNGRSGTKNDQVYLVSPETAVASALTGELCDPRELPERLGMEYPDIAELRDYPVSDNMIDVPAEDGKNIKVIRGSSIVTPPAAEVPVDDLAGSVLLHCGDKITTDHIMPAGSLLKYRSNVPEYSKYVFNCFNEEGSPSFADRALEAKSQGIGGVIVAGNSYGQGSSREHAALCPMYLGVKLVIAKTMERIHQANLVNFAICPAAFVDPADYDKIKQGDKLSVKGFAEAIKGKDTFTVKNITSNFEFECRLELSDRDREILMAGGKLNHTKIQG